MQDFKLIGKCRRCRKTRLFLLKHKTTIAGMPVTGRELLCKGCRGVLDKVPS